MRIFYRRENLFAVPILQLSSVYVNCGNLDCNERIPTGIGSVVHKLMQCLMIVVTRGSVSVEIPVCIYKWIVVCPESVFTIDPSNYV